MLGFSSEAAIFFYVGLTSAYDLNNWDYIRLDFVGIAFVIIIVGRFAAIYITYMLFSCCTKNSKLLTCK